MSPGDEGVTASEASYTPETRLTADMTDESSDEPSEDAIVDVRGADEAFEQLSDQTRLAILRALFDADGAVSFSELRDAAGVRDSGQFNYHLEKVTGAFVRKTDDGYELTASGNHVVGAILAGRYTKTVQGEPIVIDAECPSCGHSLASYFDEEYVRIACTDCDRNVISLEIPPGAFEEYPREDWPEVAERWTRQELQMVTEGFCPICHGPTTGRIERNRGQIYDDFVASVHFTCERCGNETHGNAEICVLPHPAVIALYHDHGRDLRSIPIWRLDWTVRPCATVVAESPLRIEIPIELDAERLVVTVNESAEVVDERREQLD